MGGFLYKGKSTENIISSSRLLVSAFSDVDMVSGHERETVAGEQTLTRPVVNEYGTQYEENVFEYGLVKANGEPFTQDEQRTVERWLTSPKYSNDLTLIDCDGQEICTYNGKFIKTEWMPVSGGYFGVNFEFECAEPYPHEAHLYTYTLSGQDTITLDCDSDELEEYVYPVLTITGNATGTVTITNTSDNNNTMTLNVKKRLPVIVDCQHCILRDATTSGVINFSDLGWDDVGNIYWLRLLPGENTITTSGNMTLEIKFNSVCKKVVDWR